MKVPIPCTSRRRSSVSVGIWLIWCVSFCLLSCLHQVTASVSENGSLVNSSTASSNLTDGGNVAKRMDCIDWQGRPVAHGEIYIPSLRDICTECQCQNRFPVMCKSVACSAPLNCPKAKPIAGKCCEYECQPGVVYPGGNNTDVAEDPAKEAEESMTNLSLRLIASTVTSLLFLALLLFMVYRLRQRRLLLAMRRYEARSRIFNNEDTDSDHYIPDNLMSLECPPYTDPPPPYSPPKPPHIYFGEQPPSYDEISLAGNNNTVGVREGVVERPPTHPRRSVSGSDLATLTSARPQDQPNHAMAAVMVQSAPSAQRYCASRLNGVEMLPAYASTDVVQGLDRMASTRSASSTAYRTANGNAGGNNNNNNSINANCRADDLAVHAEPPSSFYGRNGNPGGGSASSSSPSHRHSLHCQAEGRHSVPPVTAFQRFSSLFKRNNTPKSRNKNNQPRPFPECQPPPQYTTLPRSDHGSNQHHHQHHSGLVNPVRSSRNSGRSITMTTRGITDRMCFSYDSARAAYELAAMSPSTSSNSSSSSGGGLASSCSPRDRDACHQQQQQQSSLHSQQFQDDLRRHLPPLQTSTDSSEFVGTQGSPPTCPSTISPSSSSLTQAPTRSPSSSNMHQTVPFQPSSLDDNPLQQYQQQQQHHQQVCLTADPFPPGQGEAPTASIVYDLTGSVSSNPRGSPSSARLHLQQSEQRNGLGQPHGAAGNPLSMEIHIASSSTSSSSPRSSHACSSVASSQQGCDLGSFRSGEEYSRNARSKTPSPPIMPPEGAMRRSHSGVSEVSMLSVCSETGEQKLKGGKEASLDSKVLASDSQYPQHHSLSRPKLGVATSTLSRRLECPFPNNNSNNNIAVTTDGGNDDSSHYPPHNGDADGDSSFPTGVDGDSGPDRSVLLNQNGHYDIRNERVGVGSGGGGAQIQGRPLYSEGFHQENDLNQGLGNAPSSLYTSTSTPLNIRPTSPFVTSQSGQLIPVSFHHRNPNHQLPLPPPPPPPPPSPPPPFFEAEPRNVRSEGRKPKKKRSGRDRNVPGQPSTIQHSPLNLKTAGKHAASGSNVPVGNSGPILFKPDVSCRDPAPQRSGTSKSRSSRGGGEKKKRTLSSLAPHPMENAEPQQPAATAGFVPPHHRDDSNIASYGNADVYRSYVCDTNSTPSVLPNEYQQCQAYDGGNCKVVPGANGAHHVREMGDGSLGQVFHQYWPDLPANHARVSCHGDRSGQPPPTKKKATHKRQASAGERITANCHSPSLHQSQSQQRCRPKSLAAADRIHATKRGEGTAEWAASVDHSAPHHHQHHHHQSVGKGAKSGFGQDMSLDDERGMIDYFNQGVDFSASRCRGSGRTSLGGNVPNYFPHSASSSARSHAHARGGGATNVGDSSANHHAPHGHSRSGLSSDLSFVNGSASCPAEKGKKRASLPTLPMFSSSHPHSHPHPHPHPHSQAPGARNHLLARMEERVAPGGETGHRNSLPEDGQPQATSYV